MSLNFFQPFDISDSPLRYPGGKAKTSSAILSMFPDNIECIVSPFFGGGSLEIKAAAKGIKVYGYDISKPLVIFWNVLFKDSNYLADSVLNYYPLSKTSFIRLQRKIKDDVLNYFDTAVVFFVLNRSSFSGSVEYGGMSNNHPRFTNESIKKLRNFNTKNISVEQKDFSESIHLHKKDFLYCDPPYVDIKTVYGNKDYNLNFNHRLLAKILKERNSWILSYNDCPFVRELYKNFTYSKLEWIYKKRKTNEIIIFSKEFPHSSYMGFRTDTI